MKQFTPLFALFLLALRSFSQKPPIEHIGIPQGLSQGFVTCLLQDREGFIWAGTMNGLNRYDGHRFKIIRNNPYDPFSLSENAMTTLAEYGDFLLIGTWNHGLNIFHKKTGQFFQAPFQHTKNGGKCLPPALVEEIQVDASGTIWLSSGRLNNAVEWLGKMVWPPGFWEKLPDNPLLVNELIFDCPPIKPPYPRPNFMRWGQTQVTETGNFGCFQQADWCVFNPSTLQLEAQLLPPDLTGRVAQVVFSKKDSESLWQNNEQATWHFSKKTGWQQVPGKGMAIWFFDGNVVVCKRDNELSAYPWRKETRDIDWASPLWQAPTKQNFPICLLDRSGNFWWAEDVSGLRKVGPQRKFRHIAPGHSIMTKPFTWSAEDFSVAGWSNSPATDQKLAVLNKAFPDIYLEDTTSRLDPEGHTWFLGASTGGSAALVKINLTTGTDQFWKLPFPTKGRQDFVFDENGKLWFAADSSLVCFDPVASEAGKPVLLRFSYRHLRSRFLPVRAMAKTSDGSWWLGTEDGLLRAMPKPQSGFDFQLFATDPQNYNSLNCNNIASLLSDAAHPHWLWIGTKGGGLNCYDWMSGQFRHLTTANGLPDDVVYGILQEDLPSPPTAEQKNAGSKPPSAPAPGIQKVVGGGGRLWLSTNRGLVRYDPATGKINNYRQVDGLQHDEFNTSAFAKSPDGYFFFGGVNGLNLFHPKNITDNPHIPNVFITDLKINNLPVKTRDSSGILKTAVEFSSGIVLPFFHNNVTLEFAALEFTAPSKNRYRYYLEGAENPWAHEGTEPFAAYLNLAPGNYTFKVLGSNNDGVFSDTPAELHIRVLPPWYRSTLACIFYLLALGGLAYVVFRFQLNRTQLKREAEMKHREALKMKELDKLKTDFYTNISHELRTPLTVMLGMAEQVEAYQRTGKVAKIYQAVELIKRNGQSLHRLINQMLDLSRLEAGSLQLQPEPGDLIAYIKYVLESFHSFAQAKNIRLHFLSDEEHFDMDFDREKLLSILYNLLSNAIKFTPPDGNVYVEFRTGEATAVLRVKDTGIGIPAEQLRFVFDRFFQVRPEISGANLNPPFNLGVHAGGTGIGLALVKELVKLMRGEIEVKSKVGAGTEFSILLPVTRSAPPAAQNGQTGKTVPAFTKVEPPPSSPTPSSLVPHPSSLKEDLPLLLIVEDNPDVAHYIVSCVEQTYQIVTAVDGQEGLQRAIELTPDLVLSDVMMPRMDGYELCDALKNDQRTSHIPIVLLTAKADATSRIEGLRRGADAYLSKPFDMQELLVTLEKLIKLRRNLQARYSISDLGFGISDGPPKSEMPNPKSEIDLEDAFLKKVHVFVQENLDNSEYGILQLSRHLGLSQSQVFRKIKALTGKSTGIYLRSLRLQKGRELLKTTKLTVAEVAYKVGFDNPKYFSRSFLEEFGETPSESRKLEN